MDIDVLALARLELVRRLDELLRMADIQRRSVISGPMPCRTVVADVGAMLDNLLPGMYFSLFPPRFDSSTSSSVETGMK
ncbi:hypothetical protein [Tardiphaga sp. OK245]|uniref:hypothetical protein n=1 Tax=Tardiphaga sp. OK245 TaxID=1855306 RepID=UPI000B82B2F6|nr:hypothetical protein [Tardiphaga sp. OK245]